MVYREMIDLRPKSWRPNLFRLLNLGILVFYIAHWVGCLWFIVGSYEVFFFLFLFICFFFGFWFLFFGFCFLFFVFCFLFFFVFLFYFFFVFFLVFVLFVDLCELFFFLSLI